MLATHSIKNENEAVILQRALAANDPKMLEALDPIYDVYAAAIAGALQMAVPTAMADEHINLLNAFEGVLLDIKAMRVAFDDPLFALARVRTYDEHAKSLFNAFAAIQNAFDTQGIVYTSDEPGVFFTLFDI